MGVVTLNEFQTLELLPLKNTDGTLISRGPGVFTQEMLIQGNSILSSIYLHDIGTATSVDVKYYDTTTGGDLLSERFDLDQHDPQSVNGVTDRVTVTRIHNKPVMEVTVVAGAAQFGVLISVVSSFATDLDAALIEDGETFIQDRTKAIPIACYDEAAGVMRFMRCVDGAIAVTVEGAGVPFHDNGVVSSAIGSNALTSFAVPALTTRKFTQCNISSFGQGVFTLTAAGVIIAMGRTMPGGPNAFFPFRTPKSVLAGSAVSLTFELLAGQPSPCDVFWSLQASDFV